MDVLIPYIEHTGTKGMKWGLRNYQTYDVVPRISGKGGDDSRARALHRDRNDKNGTFWKIFKGKKKKKITEADKAKMNKLKQKEISKKESEAKKEEERIKKIQEENANRQRIIDHGSPEEVGKYLNTLSRDERKAVLDRFSDEQKIRDEIARNRPKEVDKFQQSLDKLEKSRKTMRIIADYAKTGTEVWDNIVPIINTFTDLELPTIKKKEKKTEKP